MGKFKGKKTENVDKKDPTVKQNRSFFIRPSKADTSKADTEKTNQQHSETETKDKTTKKPFDKKQWRLKQYSHKYKVDKWKEMRKKEILNEYEKVIKKREDQGLDVQKIYEKYDNEEDMNPIDAFEKKLRTPLQTAENKDEATSQSPPRRERIKRKSKFEEIKEEKERKRQEYLKIKAEKEAALKLYRKKKTERYKKLNKRTKKGQPIMKDRLEMLYEQVQRVCQD